MLAIISGSAACEVIGGSQVPTIVFAEEGKVLGVVVLVVGQYVEGHATKHLIHLRRVLCEESREVQQGLVVSVGGAYVYTQQGCCSRGMHSLAIAQVETACGEVLALCSKAFIRCLSSSISLIVPLAEVRYCLSILSLIQKYGKLFGL